jgi:hypothetical protein
MKKPAFSDPERNMGDERPSGGMETHFPFLVFEEEIYLRLDFRPATVTSATPRTNNHMRHILVA